VAHPASLCRQFSRLVEDGVFEDVDGIYIEAPIAGVNVGALRSQAYVIGALRVLLKRSGYHSFIVDNGTWKKQVIGHGKASKDDIRAFTESAYDLPLDCEQDVCDAAAIAQFGRIARV